MLLRDILKVKGNAVFTVSQDATVRDVVRRLVEHNVGSLVVCEGETIVGMITERDILRTVAEVTDPLEDIPVKARMSQNVICGLPEDTVGETMGLMTEKRIRHLPIAEQGKLTGLVSIGDVVKAHQDRLMMENHYLINYIHS